MHDVIASDRENSHLINFEQIKWLKSPCTHVVDNLQYERIIEN